MKMLTYWIPALFLVGVGAVWDDIPWDKPSMESVERKCRQQGANRGFDRDKMRQTCKCMTTKASAWREANPDGEYSREVHHKLSLTCFSRYRPHLTRRPSRPARYTDPELERRLSAAGAHSAREEQAPSDWGGEGSGDDLDWGTRGKAK